MTTLEEHVERCATELRQISPRGPLWNFREGGVADRTRLALANPVALVHSILERVLREADPRTAVDALPDFERVFGLPDGCAATSTSLIARRAAVLQRMSAPLGQTEVDIENAVKSFGLDCVVESHRESLAGEAAIGDLLTNEAWSHSLTIHLPDPPVVFFEAEWSGAGDPIAEDVSSAVECAVQRLAPAHAALVFEYDLPNSGYQPWDPWEVTPQPADARAVPMAPELEEF